MKKVQEALIECLSWPWQKDSPTPCVKVITVNGKHYDHRGSQGFLYGLPIGIFDDTKIPVTTDHKKAKRFRVTIEEVGCRKTRKAGKG